MQSTNRDQLLAVLKTRFDNNMRRHARLTWHAVLARLEARPDALAALGAMEASGGEPDVVHLGGDGITFCDCAPETPSGRRSLCYDRAARDARKEHKPHGSAIDLAAGMGVELLDEAGYRALQELGEFDTKTSSWIATPPEVRARGGALFGDRRYGRVFVYHNGADAYYAVRGFRALLRV